MRIYPELLVDQEFKTLGDQGFSGTLNDRQFAFLRSKGYVNALPDMMTSWLAFSFTPSSLFAASEPGIWLDPSDLTAMFQDRAGSTAVTTPGQSVGLRLDKSKGLVLGSELVPDPSFDNAAQWSASGGWVVSGGVATASSVGSGVLVQTPTGSRPTVVIGSYAEIVITVNSLATGGFAVLYGNTQSPTISAAGTYTFRIAAGASPAQIAVRAVGTTSGVISSLSVKELPGNHAVANSDAARGIYGIEPVGGRRNLLLNTTTMATQNVTVTAAAHTLSFTGTGTVTLSGVSTAGPLVGTGANDRVSLTFTPTAGTLTMTVSGSVTLAQLQIGSAFDAYQRVGTTQYDVTEAGKQTLHYVQYDGSDDGYVTPTITPGIDKVQVFAGVRKLSDAASAQLVEMNTGNSPGFGVLAPGASGSDKFAFESAGTGATLQRAAATSVSFNAPTTRVLTGIGDISGDVSRLRINGTQVAETLTEQGTGNYLAYPLYIGRRGGTTLPFNGRDYGICVRFGANLDASTISATENYMAQKTGVTL